MLRQGETFVVVPVASSARPGHAARAAHAPHPLKWFAATWLPGCLAVRSAPGSIDTARARALPELSATLVDAAVS